MKETQVQSPGREDPLEKGMDIDKETQRQSSLVGYSPWGRQELDPTEELTHRDLEGLFWARTIDLRSKG